MYKIGLIVCNFERSNPAKIAILLVSVPRHPPETGQSTTSIYFSRNFPQV